MAIKETLLDKAKRVAMTKGKGRYTEFTQEDLELVLAWLKGDIGATQVCAAIGYPKHSGNYLYYCASVLKYFYRQGRLKIKL